eukprot:TRINITY_DN3739_c0_g1_i1.p1 TRINITY_DN3739_c0_g1~~TRINITY_DN3739_c0_g1_i1.p1  ORF type:complete len:990 (-),score=367.51 TRINITY_DN3739_c0_g1_i1:27-2972(-)
MNWGSILTPREAEAYNTLWGYADLDRDNVIGVSDATNFFPRAGLQQPTLSLIWSVCDLQKKGSLTQDGFFLALRLISIAQTSSLPPNLTVDTALSLAFSRELPLPQLSGLPPFSNPSPAPAPAPTPISTPPSATPAAPHNWIVSPQERASFTEYFIRADTEKIGKITGQQARELFIRSGLSTEELGVIWELSDQNQDRFLDKNEFIVAMFLINSTLRGTPLPTVLPASVMNSLFDSNQTPINATGPLPPSAGAPINSNAEFKPIPDLDDFTKFDEMFSKADDDKDGFITGDQTRLLLERSHLGRDDLVTIWRLSDVDQDSKLNRFEFILAIYLTNLKLLNADPAYLNQFTINSSIAFISKLQEQINKGSTTTPNVPVAAPNPAPVQANSTPSGANTNNGNAIVGASNATVSGPGSGGFGQPIGKSPAGLRRDELLLEKKAAAEKAAAEKAGGAGVGISPLAKNNSVLINSGSNPTLSVGSPASIPANPNNNIVGGATNMASAGPGSGGFVTPITPTLSSPVVGISSPISIAPPPVQSNSRLAGRGSATSSAVSSPVVPTHNLANNSSSAVTSPAITSLSQPMSPVTPLLSGNITSPAVAPLTSITGVLSPNVNGPNSPIVGSPLSYEEEEQVRRKQEIESLEKRLEESKRRRKQEEEEQTGIQKRKEELRRILDGMKQTKEALEEQLRKEEEGMKAMQNEVTELEEQVVRAGEEETKTRGDLMFVRDRVRVLRSQRTELERMKNEAEGEVERFRREGEKLKGEQTWLEKELEKGQGDLDRIKSELERLQKQKQAQLGLKQEEEKLEKLRMERERQEKERKALEEERRKLQEEVAEVSKSPLTSLKSSETAVPTPASGLGLGGSGSQVKGDLFIGGPTAFGSGFGAGFGSGFGPNSPFSPTSSPANGHVTKQTPPSSASAKAMMEDFFTITSEFDPNETRDYFGQDQEVESSAGNKTQAASSGSSSSSFGSGFGANFDFGKK